MNRKQLIVALTVAAWISCAVIYELNETGWGLGLALAKSIPALVFGAVLYVWFGRAKNQ
jgi:hypothetical protein